MNTTILLDYTYHKDTFTDIDDNFAKGVVAIAYPGKNRNNSDIAKEVFEEALPTLKNKPIVGRFIPDKNDFGEHDFDIAVDPSTNESIVVNATVPFGVIPESAKQYWKTITEDDGTEHEYLFTEALFWKRQYGYSALADKEKLHQSMEIAVKEFTIDETGVCKIQKMEWEALCILGDDVEPCFESASVQLFSKRQTAPFAAQFAQMLKDLQDVPKMECAIENVEGGKTLENEIKDTAVEPEVVEVPADEPAVVDELVVDDTSAEPVVGESEAPAAEKFVKAFELSHDDIRCKLYDSLAKFESNDEYFYICEVYDSYMIVEKESYKECKCECSFLKWDYSATDEGVTLTGEPVEMFVEWCTADERNALNGMRAENETLKAENAELKEYKQSIADAELAAQKNEILDKWGEEIGDSEAFTAIKDKASEYTLDELNTALKVAYADAKATFSMSKVQKEVVPVTKVTVLPTDGAVEDPVDALFKKHGFTPAN